MDDFERSDEIPEDEIEGGKAEEFGGIAEIEQVEELEKPSNSDSHSLLITILVGLAMLLAGILLGYVGRGQFGPEAQAAKATSTAKVVAAATQTAANAELAATQAASNADLMDFLAQNTRHFKGDPNAPVTIIEFSDFQ